MPDISFFQGSNAVDSLRNSDFDAISAYGEVVDNSIQADAKNVRIKFSCQAKSHGYQIIERIAFGDDGKGMDAETLNHCLQIGWSSRYNNRDGIGRFGVGMTLGAIHECKKVEIYSKQQGGEWLVTCLDLADVRTTIPEPKAANIPNEYKDLVGKESGTLVVWSKYDRQSDNAVKLREDAVVWMGRTYRYFIWDDDLQISIDGESVKAIDPMYYTTEKTRFPDDTPSSLFEEMVISWPVDSFDAPANAPTESNIRIRMSLLDESLRPHPGAGGGAEATKRYIDMNDGISILRNRREVYYGHIPYWSTASSVKGWPRFEEKDRFWGCEIHFDAILDRAFTVKNIKRGALPSQQLKASIKDQITPTRNHCIEKIDEVWDLYRQNQRNKNKPEGDGDSIGRPEDHADAEKTAKNTPTDKSAIDSDKIFDVEADAFIDRNFNKFSKEQKAAAKALFGSQPFTIMEDTWQGSQFVEASFLGGKSVLRYNMSHIFFKEVYEIIEGLKEEDNNYEEAIRNLKALIDLLIIAHAKGEARFPKDADMVAEDFVEHLSTNWGQYLQSYVRTWKKEGSNGES
jgi:hypothetical protein